MFDTALRASLLSAPSPAGPVPVPASPTAAAAWDLDLFPTPAASLDDLEAGAPGGSLPTTLDMEPVGGATARGTLRGGDAGASVRALQQQLQARGFLTGGVDGLFGPRTKAAVRAFQHRHGLAVDGVVGPRTWAALMRGSTPLETAALTSGVRANLSEGAGLRTRLLRGTNNRHKGVPRACFRYAWTMVSLAGGRAIGRAPVSSAGRGQPLQHLDHLVKTGHVRAGDVIYVNRRPGADPSSTNLAYGPHWFVYIGNGQYADQYGIRSAAAMAAFVPGRRLDKIHRPFA
jgi:hypothetical protein